MARDYRPGHKWQPAMVCGRQGTLTYKVQVGEGVVRRHTDQLISRQLPTEATTAPTMSDASAQTEYGLPMAEDTTEDTSEDTVMGDNRTDPALSWFVGMA